MSEQNRYHITPNSKIRETEEWDGWGGTWWEIADTWQDAIKNMLDKEDWEVGAYQVISGDIRKPIGRRHLRYPRNTVQSTVFCSGRENQSNPHRTLTLAGQQKKRGCGGSRTRKYQGVRGRQSHKL